MKKPDALQGSLDLLVLQILARKPGAHGYAIMNEIRLLSGEVLRVEEGSLYPALHRMEKAGWLRSQWFTKENGRRTRQYEATRAGLRHLEDGRARWQQVSAAIQQVLQES